MLEGSQPAGSSAVCVMILRAILRLLFYVLLVMGPLIVALIVDQWSHVTAQVIAHLWFLVWLIVLTQRRPPALYGSYQQWWADRSNWWVKP